MISLINVVIACRGSYSTERWGQLLELLMSRSRIDWNDLIARNRPKRFGILQWR